MAGPMKERLHASDYRFILACLVLFCAATWYSTHNFYRAFPEASIDFRVNRDGGRSLAERFLAAQNYNLAGYRQASRFAFDDIAKTFIEREAGLEQANRLMGSRLRLWRWEYRWFQPQHKEEYRAAVTVTGEIAGFTHELPEDAARSDATTAEARTLAEDFLRTWMHRDPTGLEFVEVNETARPHRTDRIFTWKESDFNLHDATYRFSVTTIGNEVGGVSQYLKVPEQWERDFEHLRSKNALTETVDTAVMVALLAGMVVILVMRTRRQDVRWRRAGIVGAIGMVLALCAQLNSLPLAEFGYPTTDSYPSFLSRHFLNALLAALASGAFLFLMTAGSEPLYREAFHDQISLGNLFRPRGLRTKRFFKGAILGITLTAIFIAYQTIFYIVASRLGAWAPADIPYSDELNTLFPWVFVLFGGYFPAVFEEFVFRMFAIPFLRRLVRWLPLALVLAGFIWGFGHAGYPNEPFYIRGVEVGIGGVALGIIMLRWGILPTLVWHYSVDAMYSAILLLRSPSLYFKLSGAASAGVIVLPVMAALIAYRLYGGFESDQGLHNADEPGPVELVAVTASDLAVRPPYQALAARVRLAAIAILAAGLLAYLIPVERFGDSPRYNLTTDQALAPADAFVREQGLDPISFRHVTYPLAHWGSEDSMTGKYFLERQSMASASKMFQQYRPIQCWATRYYRSLDQEEVLVTVHPESRRILSFNHTLPEDRPGADLTDDAARQIAATFAGARGIELAAMELKESTSEKKKSRRDHTLVWEALVGDPRNLDEARYRVEINVSGDRVSSWRSFWKLPETYTRRREQRNFISITVTVLRIALILVGIGWGLWQLVRNIRQGLVRWNVAMPLAAMATLLMSGAMLLGLPLAYQNYPTAIPVATFEATLYIGVALTLVGGFLMMGAIAGLLTSSFPDSINAFRAASLRWTGVDAVCAALAAVGLVLCINRLNALLNARFHASALLSIGPPSHIATASPAVAALAGAISPSAIMAAALAIIVLIARRVSPTWILSPLALVALLGTVTRQVHTPGELALQYGMAVLTGAAAYAFCLWFGRSNYVAYGVVFWALSLRTALAELFGNDLAGAHAQGWIVAAALAFTVIWVLFPARTRRLPFDIA
jgi:membrane protease YdiL (CAAX protease family)